MENRIKRLKRSLEKRKRQLTGVDPPNYELHSGHHLRDVITALAVLNGDPKANELLENMPK